MTGRRLFPACDGLRAMAAGSVFLFHAADLTGVVTTSAAGAYLFQLDVGVDVFFVLSGFLLYRPFVRAHLEGGPAPTISRYYKRRVLRIFPAYWLALFLLLLLGDIDVNGTTGLLKHATLTNTYFHDIGGLGIAQSWTLVVELSFYVFVPLWALCIRAASRGRFPVRFEVAGALGLILVGYSSSAWVFYGSPPPAMSVLPPGFGALGAGMLLAVLSAAGSRDARLAAHTSVLGRAPAVSWSVALGGSRWEERPSRFRFWLPRARPEGRTHSRRPGRA